MFSITCSNIGACETYICIKNHVSFFGFTTMGRHKLIRAEQTRTIWSTTGATQPFWRQTIEIGNFLLAIIGYFRRSCPHGCGDCQFFLSTPIQWDKAGPFL